MRSVAKSMWFQLQGSQLAVRRRLRNLRKQNKLTILSFHRVAPPDGSSYAPLAPALFDEVIGFCSEVFELLTFAQLEDHRLGPKPPAIITFDDGYKDFIEQAMPILAGYGVRCNLNIIPGCVESGLPPPNVLLQDFIGKASPSELAELDIPGFGRAGSSENRVRLGERVSNHLRKRPMREQREIMAPVLERIGGLPGFRPTPMMREEDVRSAAAVHEIGAHSFEHASLLYEDDDYVRADARKCQAYLIALTGRSSAIYALPNGMAAERQLGLIADEGFRHILLTGETYSKPAAHYHPRFTMWGEGAAELRARATGFTRTSGTGLPVQ
jgi:peptidoglycan/xylan/chitin deacetylase (PgdA/CDA1 family)